METASTQCYEYRNVSTVVKAKRQSRRIIRRENFRFSWKLRMDPRWKLAYQNRKLGVMLCDDTGNRSRLGCEVLPPSKTHRKWSLQHPA
jgi:hypothetical protein